MKLSQLFFPKARAAAQAGPGAKRDLVQKHFNAVARHYDLANTIMSLGLHCSWKRRAVRLLDPKPGQRLADICGGTADLSLMAQRRRWGKGLILVYDLNQAMLDRGQAKARRSPLGRELAFIRGDAEDLAIASGSLDGAIVGFGVRNLSDLAGGLREMHRILRPGGKLACLEFSQPRAAWFGMLYDFYTWLMMPLVGRVFTGSWSTYAYLADSIRSFPAPQELARLMRDAGFGRVAWQRLSAGIATIHLAMKP
jgi:demethylmenaquinone methyltransferase/2-methoxy-6-polyprenyl-1,4-benzoquinol methylase